MNSSIGRLTVLVLFLLSGFAALIYQVAWQRMLVVFAGGDVYSITIVVAAFMTGLGLGGLAGGFLADKGSSARNLTWFAAAELSLAIFGYFSKLLFYDLLYYKLGGLADSRAFLALILTSVLIVPTFLMGMSLPLLTRAMIRDLADAAAVTGRLYGANTLGAACGAMLATWVFIPLWGLDGAIKWAAAFNFVSAVVAAPLLWLGRHGVVSAMPSASPVSVSAKDEPLVVGEQWSIFRCLIVCCLSGFLALALEIAWFRILGVMLKSTAFTFGTLLAIYLAGAGLGSLAGMMIAGRSQRPASVFMWMQWGSGVYAGLILAAVLAAVTFWPQLKTIKEYLNSYEPIDANSAASLVRKWAAGTLSDTERSVVWIFPALHFLLPLIMIGPPTFAMGLSYPFLQKAVHSDLDWVGRRTGWVQTSNIAGCLLGAAATSALLLPQLGTAGTMRLLVFLAGGFGLLAAGRSVPRFTGVFVVTAATMALMPDHQVLWARVHGSTPDRIRAAEDGSGVAVLKLASTRDHPTVHAGVFVNGSGQSFIPFGGVHSLLGALPAILHPKPEHILVIGLGSGDTVFSAAGRAETAEIICAEIISAQIKTLHEHVAAVDYPPLRTCLTDPRIHHVSHDGRHFLLNTQRRFDIIEADALRPASAHAGTLYSIEYFRLLRSRLKPGGFAVTWSPTQRVSNTFMQVFPYVVTHGAILIGSNEPFQIDPAAIQQRTRQPDIHAYYRSAGIDITEMAGAFVAREIAASLIGPEHDRSQLTDVNTDIFPLDEVGMAALWQPAEKKTTPSPSSSAGSVH